MAHGLSELERVVEARIIEAAWTLRRLPDHERRFQGAPRGGSPAYVHTPAEIFAAAVANEGQWDQIEVRPARPSSGEIDRWFEALHWLSWLDRRHAGVLFHAASQRRGESGGRVSWARVSAASGVYMSRWTMQRMYSSALADIAARLAAGALLQKTTCTLMQQSATSSIHGARVARRAVGNA